MRSNKKTTSALLASLGAAIRRRRSELHISQEDLAELGDFDRTYVSLLERGRRNPSFVNICRVAAALNMTPSALLEGLKYAP